MANPEIQIKALEKTLSAIEKKFDQYDKQFQKSDYGPEFRALGKQLDALEKKHDALEKKYDALEKKHDVIEKMVLVMAPMVKDPAKFLKEAGGLDRDLYTKLNDAALERERKDRRKEIDAIHAKNNKELEKAMDKIMSDQLKAFVDARLKPLEAVVSTLMKSQR